MAGLAAAVLWAGLARAATEAPDFYVRRTTWLETLHASMHALDHPETIVRPPARDGKPFQPRVSRILTARDEAEHLQADITGQTHLVLIAGDAGNGINSDHAVWASPRLKTAAGEEVWLDTLQPVSVFVGSGQFFAGPRPVTIGAAAFDRHIWAHANSVAVYRLPPGRFVSFEAWVGVDQRSGGGSVQFTVSNDPAKGGPVEGLEPFWARLLEDFPSDETAILIVKDWFRQEKRAAHAARADFEAPARAALALVSKTAAFLEQAGADPAPFAAARAALTARAERAEDWRGLFLEARQLRRRMILSHPALDFDRILINRTPPTTYSHNGDQHLGRHSRIGPGLTLLEDWKDGRPRVRAILEGKLPPGSTRSPDLHYDAGRVVFAYCDHARPGQKRYFLYEAAVDGAWVRPLTGTRRDRMETWDGRATVLIEDNDPCYLPDGGLVFISTRGQTFGRCHGGRYNPAWILYRADGDGGNIRQLSYGNENEYEPAVLNDGRIVFTRWEYTNRHEMFFHMLWWCRPDGTMVSNFYGNDTVDPMMVTQASALPGTHKVAAIAMGHHSYSTGTVVLLDSEKGENGEAPVTRITPETPYSESHGWPNPHYSHPCAITEDLYLVSRAHHPVPPQGQTPPPNDRGIYLVDTLGGRELIYEDPDVASVSPIAVRSRVRPPVLPSVFSPNAPDQGTVFVQNAYLTRNDPEGRIKPGAIKAIRVLALGVQPRAGRAPCSMTVPVEIPKKVLGTVPVGADGSALFKVPARTALQLQILDEHDRAILTDRSFFYLQPGENRSCTGCHEPPGLSPDQAAVARAARRTPLELTPAAGPAYAGGLSFMRTVQPVLDRYCIDCHGLAATNQAVNLVHDGQLTWPQSLKALVERGDHRLGEKGYMGAPEKNISRPYAYYAHGNKVAQMIITNHANVRLDPDSRRRIIEWLDTNAQGYGDLFPNKLEERRIDPRALEALRAHIRSTLGEPLASQPERALINVAQVDESRILLAPLAAQAGGWGQVKGWDSREDPGYRTMRELVEACILRRPDENTRGWTPTLETGGGEAWVVEENKAFVPTDGTE